MRSQPRLAACGPARHAPTTTAPIALEGASHKEDDDDMLLRAASISKDLLAEGLLPCRALVTLDVDNDWQHLPVGHLELEAATPSRTCRRACCRLDARHALKGALPPSLVSGSSGDFSCGVAGRAFALASTVEGSSLTLVDQRHRQILCDVSAARRLLQVVIE